MKQNPITESRILLVQQSETSIGEMKTGFLI